MTKQARLWVGALVAGVLVAVLPAWLTGPGTDLSGSLNLGGSLFVVMPVLFAAGVLTSLTPCVYPLIPITVSIFGARSAQSRGRGAALSLTYVLGIATMYSSLGVAAAASGKAFGSFMGNPWVVGAFALVMLAFAASMFGLFEISVPSALQGRLASVRGIGFGSAFAMGLVAGIIAAPCTGPVLGAVLTFVASTSNLWLGFWLLFSYAMGMGLLFFVLGTFTVKLPKGGAWMEGVKAVLGVALVVVAISFVRPLLPKAPEVALNGLVLAIVGAVAVAIGILIGGVHKTFAEHAALKSTGLVLIVLAFSFRLGWIVTPEVAHVQVANGGATIGKIEWMHDEAAALAKAKAEGKHVLIDFFAEWCAACKELDKFTFTDPRVREVVAAKFVPLKVDGTEDTDAVTALQSKYGVVGLPLVTVVGPDGVQLKDPRIEGFLEAEKFLKELEKARAQ